MRRLPFAAVLLAALAAAAAWGGEAAAGAMEWRHDWAWRGEYWRPLTGHLCHWSFEHSFWNIAAFAVLGAVVERSGRGRFLLGLAATAVLTELLLGWNGDYARFRGLSGWAMCLAGLASLEFWQGSRERGNRWAATAALVAFAALLGKAAFEMLFGSSLFVATGSSGFRVATESHVAGLLAAGLVWLVWSRWIGEGRATSTRQPQASSGQTASLPRGNDEALPAIASKMEGDALSSPRPPKKSAMSRFPIHLGRHLNDGRQ